NYTTNLALEFGLLDNRLYGTVEYFNRDSKNLLQSVPTSLVTGFSSILRNVGEVNNKGIEFELGYEILRTDDWKWNASVNGSLTRSKVTEHYVRESESEEQPIIWNHTTGGDARAQFFFHEGESMLSFYGFERA